MPFTAAPPPRATLSGAEVDRMIRPVESRPGVSVIRFQREAMAGTRVVVLHWALRPVRSAVSHMHDRERMPSIAED
jgi:hypothetical protein